MGRRIAAVFGSLNYQENNHRRALTVSRQAIRNPNNKLLGYIETCGDGRQKATDANNKTLGYFDAKRNVTTDTNNRVLARANILTGLIYDQR
jgi:hypothetical protein